MSRAAYATPQPLTFAGADGVALRADARGDAGAPVVLFLHGGGQTRHAWGGSAAALAADGRYAICLDLRGHGESDWASGDHCYRLERFAADLRAVIEQLGGAPVLVGASLGGLTSLLAVGESPNPIARAAVLVDIAPRIERVGAERITRFMLARPDGYENLEEVAEAVAGYTKQRSRLRDLTSLRKNLRSGDDGRFYWHWDPRFMGPDGPAEIADRERLFGAAREVSVPALLVRGRESDILSQNGVREFLAHLPDADFVDVAGAGHMVAGDRNDAFTEAVRTFLSRVAPLPA
jgi:pimeloyl-ACP methyl ester carboxylesterase